MTAHQPSDATELVETPHFPDIVAFLRTLSSYPDEVVATAAIEAAEALTQAQARATAAEARVQELEAALRKFAAVAELMRPLGAFETWADDKPNREFIPGSWPVWSDFKVAAILCVKAK